MGTRYDYTTEISALGERIALAHFKNQGIREFPIDPELIAEKYFGLQIVPISQLHSSLGVKSGLDSTQSVLFIDERIYLQDDTQYIARQSIAHEIGHIVYDSNLLRANTPRTPEEAYRLHLALRNEAGSEHRANNFAGALLVPRRELLVQASKLLKAGLPDIQLSNPDMTIETLVLALSSAKLSNYFGVSDDVIRWRLDNESFISLIGLEPGTKMKDVDVESVLSLCSTEAERLTPRLPDRIKSLIPTSLISALDAIT